MNRTLNTEISFAQVTDKTDRIILSRNCGPGDVVCMAVPSNDEGWNVRPVENGTVGEVIGFTMYEDSVAPIHNFGRKPGVYLVNGAPIIRWSSAEKPDFISVGNPHDLVHLNPSKAKARRNKVWQDTFERRDYLRELPQLPYCELDTVFYKEDGEQYYIRSISYHDIDNARNDGSPWPIYDLTAEGRGSFSVTAYEIQLVSRGNLWKWQNDKSSLSFASLQEEIAFHIAIGLYQQIRCPDTKNYEWPKESVGKYAREGLIDVVQVKSGFFGAASIAVAHKFSDEDLSKRCNAKLQEGFD